MFGFGKKKSEEKQNAASGQIVPAAAISDDKFVVMPEQYVPRATRTTGAGMNKKVLLLTFGAFIFLGAFGAVLYAVILAPEAPGPALVPITERGAGQSAETQTPDAAEIAEQPAVPTETIVRGQALDAQNLLIGSLAVTVPATVVQQYGSGIGITVLTEDDLALPSEGVVLGGLYSLYPAGVTFTEPLSIELSAASIPDSYDPADVYPAYLRGVRWEELPDYQTTLSGFAAILEKAPSGPLAVIWNPEEEHLSGEDLSFTRAFPTVDTDADGLTDAEEALFGTSAASPDTDSDSYLDLEEIQNGYSPLAAGALLSESGLFGTYTNATYGYRVEYPAHWLADSLDQSNKQVLFISDTEEFFEILIVENPLNTPIIDWFRGQSPSLANVKLEVVVISGAPSVWSPDGLTLYTASNGLIYIITYNNGTSDEISWPNVFKHFYSSFTFGETSTEGETAEEAGTGAALE